jgi:hypothetical protein
MLDVLEMGDALQVIAGFRRVAFDRDEVVMVVAFAF